MNSLETLNHYWGHTQFRSPQEEIIEAVLEKRDVVAILPTGGGKSICFQIPALMQEGIGDLFSPDVSLPTIETFSSSRKEGLVRFP